MRHGRAVLAAAGLLAAVLPAVPAAAQGKPATAQSPSDPKAFNVTVRRLGPARGFATGTDSVLPVDSPDEEHAAVPNAVALPRKVDGGAVPSVAFARIGASLR